MSETSKKPQQNRQRPSAQDAARKSRQAQAAAVAARRTLSRKKRDEQRQRRLIISVGTAVGLALLVLIGGLLYDQVWLPSRAVAQVNESELSRRDYWQQRRLDVAQQIIQNFQLLAIFGNNEQMRSQFAGQSPQLDQIVPTIPQQPPDASTITAWQDEQLTQQGSAQFAIQVSADGVNQEIASSLASTFLPTPVLTPTDELTGTGTLTESDALSPTESLEPTPQPTPEAAQATEQVGRIVDVLYEQYTAEIQLVGLEPALSKEDFRQALERQYRRQLLNRKLQEALVPEEGFEATDEPNRVTARHILLSVETPPDAAQEEIDEAFEQRKEEAERLIRRLRNGADFAELAAEYSDDPGSKDSGGDVGAFDTEGRTDSGATFVPEFVAAAFALEDDEISDPVRTQFGWHIIQVTDREVPGAEEQLRTAQREALDSWLAEQRTTSTVRQFPEPTPTPTAFTESQPTLEPTYVPGPPTPFPTAPIDESLEIEPPPADQDLPQSGPAPAP